MSAIPRMELDELFAKYSNHPDVFDIYVEGNFDRDVLRFILDEMGYGVKVSIYPIGDVNVSDGLVAEFGLNHGSNKSRLIALAKILGSQNFSSSNVTCFVDADADRLLKKVLLSRHLYYTDYTCMEMYCVNLDCLKKFFELTCGLTVASMNEFLDQARLILPAQFALRAVNEILVLNSPVPPFQSGVAKEKGKEVFSAARYVQAYIAREKLHLKRELIEREFNANVARLDEDLRHKAHGHDFIELLFEYLSKKGIMKFHGKAEEVEKRGGRMLSSSLVAAKVFAEGFFQDLDVSINGKRFMWP